jgi:2-oxoglutarate ferredoxin oxidoreductase subunit gamma
METRILIAGFGGQGVLLMGQLLSKAGMHENLDVCWMPSYGPEMRGGEANCGVVLADEPIGSPIVTEPDVAILMNRPSLDKFESAVIPGGSLLYNSSLIDREIDRTDVMVYAVPCNDIAAELGNPRVANIVMLGAFNALTNLLPMESLIEVLRETLGKSKEHLIPINQKALAAGAKAVEES